MYGKPLYWFLSGERVKDFANRYQVMSRELNSNLCRKICIRSLQVATSFSLVIIATSIFGKRDVVENLYSYHVLTTKTKDQQLRN